MITTAPFMVKFTQADRDLATRCAHLMLASAQTHGAKDKWGRNRLRSHYCGALGEIAFAAFRRVPWKCHPGDIGGVPDVDGYEVRSLEPESRYMRLKCKDNDKDQTPLAGVIICAGRDADDNIVTEAAALIYGWALAIECRQYGVRRDPGRRGAPAYFLEDLRRLHTEFPA